MAVKFSLFEAWREASKRSGRQDVTIAIAARSRSMVRMISDALEGSVTVGGKVHGPIAHDVMFDQMQIVLAARAIAHSMASTGEANGSKNCRRVGTDCRYVQGIREENKH